MSGQGKGVRQLDMFEWSPPSPVVRFPDGLVRSRSIAAAICRSVAIALKDCAHGRDIVATRMGAFLAQRVSVHMLNAYASQSRDDQMISLPRFVALIHATGDRRLLEMIAEMFGWSVIERRYLPLIELAMVRERQEELARRRRSLSRLARAGGVL